MRFEEEITKGSIFYIHSIVYNSNYDTLKINFLFSPENQKEIKQILTFSNIQLLSDKLDFESFDEDCLDSLIGIEISTSKSFIPN
jgi:hypothetical protein